MGDHPMAPLLKRPTNQHMLEISSDGYSTQVPSTVTIEADMQYTVSLIVKAETEVMCIILMSMRSVMTKDYLLELQVYCSQR